MNKAILRVTLCFAIVCAASTILFAQGRGRGNGLGRRFDVFGDSDFRRQRGRNQNWKCGKFVNCHDARNGRWDGRGPTRSTGFWRNGIFYPRGSNVGYRRRYSTNDYWRRRHLTYGNRYYRWPDR